jgi:putative membrane protein
MSERRPGADHRSDEHGGRARRAVPAPRKPRLVEIGEEPDPRFTFANERTFLAWNRTGLALIAGGLAVVEFVHFHLGGARLAIAIPLILFGGILGFASFRRWDECERALRLNRPLPYSRLPAILALATAVLAVGAAVLVIVSHS